MLSLYIGNNCVLELQALTNVVTATADTAATVTVTLQDRFGSEVAGQVWPATMGHTANGTYQAVLDHDLDIQENTTYVAVIDAVGSGGEIAHWEIPVRAVDRNA